MIAKRLFQSSIGRKTVVAVTGSLLVLFLIVHMLGNWNMLIGQESMNHYAHTLKSMPGLLWTARIGLLLMFVVHIALTISLNIENRMARPQKYVYKDTVKATLSSRIMVVSGLILLVFVVFHILHFTVGAITPDTYHLKDAQGRHDVYRMVIYGFMNPYISTFYVVSMFIVASHLSHGIQSVLQTLGITNRQNMAGIRKISIGLATLLFVGFSIVPLLILLNIISLPAGG
jgi:succinate dehydrogenase / fumarate reductase cytochrome b subunit